MEQSSTPLKTLGTITAVIIAGILLGGILSVPYRATKSPEGYDQPRMHLNTKNSTRFGGENLGETAVLVSRALYPATNEASSPDAVLLYDPENWQAGLEATPLLRALNAVLLPATGNVGEEISRLNPAGSEAAGGAGVLLLGGMEAPDGVSGATGLASEDMLTLLQQADANPRHAILVSEDDPATALLAAPWAAYSGDLVVFDTADVPQGMPLYALGDVEAREDVQRIDGGSPVGTAVAFASYEDADNPLFGWGFNAGSLTGYRSYSLARADQPGAALLSANLAVRGKPGPLLWVEERELPAVVNNYLWSQRAAFWETPAEGPFHHFWILGGEQDITFPAQSQADYAVEIGPYFGKGPGMSGTDMLAAAWVALGIASAVWILVHQARMLLKQNWVMRLAWPLLAIMVGPFGILFYYLAYSRPVIRKGKMVMWDRPLWLQGMVATASAVGFGASIMIVSGFLLTLFGMPLIPSRAQFLYLLGTPMILLMIVNYVVAVLVSWPIFQTPMMSMFHGKSYQEALPMALPTVLVSMTAAALGMNPGMWWLMMSRLQMMPTEESIQWFGVMFFTGFLAFLVAWPLNYILVRAQKKAGLM